jgi:hypothetical protein
MKRITGIATAFVPLGLAACGSIATPRVTSTVAPTFATTSAPTASIAPATAAASPTPSSTPIEVVSPLAAVGAPRGGDGAGPYVLGLVNAAGKVVASVTATTPSDFGPGNDPSLTSTSGSRLYFENGNTAIDYLTPTGQHGVAFTVARPAGGIVAFAVSPDDTRVAVATLSNWNSAPPYTSHMYLVAMGGGIEQTLFDGTGTGSSPLTWPIGWDGSNLVVAQSFYYAGVIGGGPCGSYGTGATVRCSDQLREFNPATRSFGPILCAGGTMSGVPTAVGIACTNSGLQAVSWFGTITSFGSSIPIDDGPCTLSPQGAVIACPSALINVGTSEAQDVPAHLFRAGGVAQSIPNPGNAQIIGWIDGNDVVVTTGADSRGLAVENIVTGKQIPVSLATGPEDYVYEQYGELPGGL